MSMRDLAKATDRSLASFYNYFPSKEEVLFALQSRSFETLIATASGLVDKATDPSGRLYLFIANHVTFFMDHGSVMRVLLHEASALPAPKRRRIRRLKEKYFQILRDIVAVILSPSARRRAADTATIERSTYNIFGMVNWVHAWYQPRRHGSPREAIRTIHHMAMQGLVGTERLDPVQERMDALLEDLPSPIALSPIAARKGAA